MKNYAITLTHTHTNSTFVRTLPASKIKSFVQKAQQEGYVIRASRPVGSR